MAKINNSLIHKCSSSNRTIPRQNELTIFLKSTQKNLGLNVTDWKNNHFWKRQLSGFMYFINKITID